MASAARELFLCRGPTKRLFLDISSKFIAPLISIDFYITRKVKKRGGGGDSSMLRDSTGEKKKLCIVATLSTTRGDEC